jgi:hypothetical protein
MLKCPHCHKEIEKGPLYCPNCKKDIESRGKEQLREEEVVAVIQEALKGIPKSKYTYSLNKLEPKSVYFEIRAKIVPKNKKAAELEIMFNSEVWEISFSAGNAFFMEWYFHSSNSKFCQLSKLREAWEAVIAGNYREEHWGKEKDGEYKDLVGIYTTKEGKEIQDGCINNIFPGWIRKRFFHKTPEVIRYEAY